MNINFYDLFLNKFLMSTFFVIGGFLVYTFLSLVIDRFTHKIDPDAPYGLASFDQRVFSLSGLLKGSARFLLIILVLILIFLQFKFQTWGVVFISGLVLWGGSFWLQELIRDLAQGFFIFFENQYQIGDEVKINGTIGTVEKLTLRATFIRSSGNEQWIFPHHLIKETVNFSKGSLKNILEIGFNRNASREKIKPLVEKILEEYFQKNPAGLEEKPRVAGLGKIFEEYFFYRIEYKSPARDRAEIAASLKKALCEGLEKENIFFVFDLA